jgi:endonuclease/exonuclease/phosphatase family metal-dependent hydrolase
MNDKNNLKIISYNIHKGLNTRGTKLVLHKMRKELERVDADIVFLQEVVGEHTGQRLNIDGHPDNNQIEFLASNRWEHFIYGPNKSHGKGHHGNAILSKFPILEWENHNISTNKFECRGLLHAKVKVPNLQKDLHLYNTHLNLLEKGRKIQAKKIIQILENTTHTHDPLLMAGDFNDWKKSIIHFLAEHLEIIEAFHHFHGEVKKTYPSFFPGLSLDRIFFKNLIIEDAIHHNEQSWKGLSDHLPLTAHFLPLLKKV